jgi:hypothetical protein
MKLQKLPKTIRTDLLSYIKERTNSMDQDCMIVALGARGNGKSTAMMEMQFEYDDNFNLDKIGWSMKDHKQKILFDLSQGEGYHADEIRFHVMDYRTSLGVEMDKFLTEIRPFNLFTTWSSARIHKILRVFLEYAHFLFYFYDIGECVVLQRNDKILVGNAFGIDAKKIEKIDSDKTFEKYFIKPAKKRGTYYGRFIFPRFTKKFTPEVYRRYKKIRIESTRREYGGDGEVLKLPRKLRLLHVKRGKEVGVTHAQLAHIFDVSTKTISNDVNDLKVQSQ